MNKINFTKMVASGNDFVVIENVSQTSEKRYKSLAKNICDRKYGVGADGLLLLGKSKIAHVNMRIFNSDGSEAEMCGNGARCVAFYKSHNSRLATRCLNRITIETRAGIIESRIKGCDVKIKLTDPGDAKFDIPIKINGRTIKVNFINTGVPHVVVFVEGLDKIDVFNLGRFLRNHKEFAPRGTNVNFIEFLGRDSLQIRTYERGVEDETLACGTGSVASALIFALKTEANKEIKVHTKSSEVLKVYFKKDRNKFSDVWLQGRASIVFKGILFPLKGGSIWQYG